MSPHSSGCGGFANSARRFSPFMGRNIRVSRTRWARTKRCAACSIICSASAAGRPIRANPAGALRGAPARHRSRPVLPHVRVGARRAARGMDLPHHPGGSRAARGARQLRRQFRGRSVSVLRRKGRFPAIESLISSQLDVDPNGLHVTRRRGHRGILRPVRARAADPVADVLGRAHLREAPEPAHGRAVFAGALLHVRSGVSPPGHRGQRRAGRKDSSPREIFCSPRESACPFQRRCCAC